MFPRTFTYIALSITITCGHSRSEPADVMDLKDLGFPGSGRMSFTKLASKYGYKAEEYEVITEDGYILTLFHIRGKSPPVLLVHGILDSSDTWLLRGEKSLGITLANSGYDVWFGNTRGNLYSRRHVTLNPDVDKKFWDFSFNEIGYYDYPAILDKILNETGTSSITAIAHSQGTTAFYVLGANRSEYNSKINILISLAPVCYIHHAPAFSILIKIRHALKEFFTAFQIYEFLGDKSRITKIFRFICSQPIIGYKLCAVGLLSALSGSDLEEMEPSFYRIANKYTPSGTSVQSLLHYLQIGNTKVFAPYDYGERNQLFYNSTVPPPYDLSKVSFPNALLAARNDHASALPDVALLREQLPNVVYYLVNPRRQFNHLDDIWGRRIKKTAEKTRLLNRPVLNFTEIAAKHNYKTEEYQVITEDGYILGLFRIPGRRRIPIIIMHGLADTSDTWLLRGESSLGITLAKFEYDLWFGNVRGNKYSRRHITLDPDKDSTFWHFSFHEHGYYDLSALIDTVLSKTGAPKVNAIGHSQGNAIFYVLGSSKPEYNEKVNKMIALAPICYLTHIPPPLSLLIEVAPELNAVLKAFGINELFGDISISGELLNIVCNNILTGYPICWLGTLMPMTGFDIAQYGPKFYALVTEHFPSSTTRKNLYHYGQVSRRRSFSRYDYGPEKNMKIYNSIMPPDYNVKNVSMPVVLIAGKNDKLAVLSDVATLRGELPNVEKYILIKRDKMSHMDFIWGRDMKDYLFPYIFEALRVT